MRANAYAAYRSQSVETASPAQLVLMLYNGALAAIVRARFADARPDRIEALHRELTRAQAIVTELLVTLDRERGGDIAGNLAALYEFCLERLLDANLAKDLTSLPDVELVLTDLRDTWLEACGAGIPAPALP